MEAASRVTLDLPTEFVDFCAAEGLTPEQVLSGFIGDLAGITYPASHSATGGSLQFNSHGSDERYLARQWFQRVCWPTPARGVD